MTEALTTTAPPQPVKLEDIRQGRELYFPSRGSLQWHFRTHKARYARDGAIRIIRGAVYVIPARFDEVYDAISREEAVRMLARSSNDLQAAA